MIPHAAFGRKTLAVGLTALALALLAPAGLAAEIVSETRAVHGFSQIELDGQADVTLRQGQTEGVTLEATASALRDIRTEVRGRKLTIRVESKHHWWQWLIGAAARTPKVTIDFIQLDRLEASGAVAIVASSLKASELHLDFAGACRLKIADLQANRLRVDGAGATRVDLAGRVAEQDIDLSGAGSYRAEDLVSDRTALQVSGAGKAIVNATKTLKAGISGAGLVEYVGDPAVERDVSGIGKIRRR
ncbi:MAG TPA: head GIN domain-containing protein [Casimicrobiaceae bacterium]|nr:head GIN domain-containing protein [Casimicrobiaceae bacterium]